MIGEEVGVGWGVGVVVLVVCGLYGVGSRGTSISSIVSRCSCINSMGSKWISMSSRGSTCSSKSSMGTRRNNIDSRGLDAVA